MLELFLRHAMPTLDVLFRSHRELVQGLLKGLQQSTRFMQHLCGYSKVGTISHIRAIVNHVFYTTSVCAVSAGCVRAVFF